MNKSQNVWIKEGYFEFSREGISGLNIERIARNLNKNKSSFYHYFGDIETYQEALLDYHLERADLIALKGRLCKNMIPDVINLLIETKDDLLFNKQLRINYQDPIYKNCFDKSFGKITGSFIDQWNVAMKFENKPMLGTVLLKLVADNFFLQVTAENLTFEWFQKYLHEIRSIIGQMNIQSK